MNGWGVRRLAMQHDRAKGNCDPALISLATALVGAPMLLGGAFPWAVSATAVLVAIAGVLASRRLEIRFEDRERTRLLDWAVVAALLWTGIQLVPMPSSLVSLLSPDTADAWQANARLYGERGPSWIPFSLDPGATRLELAKGLAIAAAYLCARVFTAAGRRRAVFTAVGASGLCMAVVAFAHELADASSVFGVYEPMYASSRLLAPLMNENHLGGFMALTSPVLLGLALESKTKPAQLGWGLGAACCAAAGVLSFSRAAILALALAAVLFLVGLALKLRRDGGSIRNSRALPMLMLGLFGLVAGLAVVAGPELAREFGYTHNRTVKLEVALAALPVLLQAPAIGFGRGAFAAAFVGDLGPNKRFYYPENILVQWTAEWGLVFGLLLLGLVVYCIARGFRSARTLTQVGALTGLVAIGVHDLADFSLEMSGVAVVAAAMMGAAADSPRARPAVSLRSLCLGVSLLAFAGAGLAASVHGRDTSSLEKKIRSALAANDYARVRELVDLGLRFHPAEPILALAGAEVAVRRRAADAGHWLNRSQQLAPLWSSPHLLTARWLFQTNEHDQGLVELRQAEAKNRGSTRETICAILRETDDAEIAFRAAPEGPAGLDFLDRTAACLAPGSEASATIDAALREREPQLVGPTVRQAKRLLHAGDTARAVEILAELKEPDVEAGRALAMAQLRNDDAEEAQRTIAPLLGSSRVSGAVLHTALSIYVALGSKQEAQRIMARLRALKPDPKSVAELGLRLGRLYEAEGQPALALEAYEDANEALESPATLSAIARLARELGQRERALLAYKKLCRSQGSEGASCTHAQDLTKRTSVAR